MALENAIRTRRTHKRFGHEPVPHEVIEELLELARWAPNHHLTEPWRFRVLGPESIARLAETGKPGELEKLSRAPTLIVASARLTGDEHQNQRCARDRVRSTRRFVAHERGFAPYWRTPRVLQAREGQAAIGMGEEEFVAWIHLGPPVDASRCRRAESDH